MADEITNPYLQLSMQSMLAGNPYTQNNGKLSMPGFRGLATDAQGRPIASDAAAVAQSQQPAPAQAQGARRTAPAQGTTMTSIPDLSSWGPSGSAVDELLGNYQAAQAAMTPQQKQIQAQNNAIRMAGQPASGGGGFGQMSGGAFNPSPGSSPSMGMLAAQPSAAPPAAAPAAAPTTNGVDLRQAYLDALANPGHVATPRRDRAAEPALGVPSVLQAFLAAHPSGGGTGAGAYDNSGFFDTLNQLGRTG